MSGRPVPPQQGDEVALFERYAERLRRVTQLQVRTSPEIVDDACAFAWVQFLAYQPDRAWAFSWLKKVAQREALRLDGMARKLLAYEDDRAGTQFPAMTPNRGDIEETQGMMEVRERLAELPERQREIVFLHAAGWRYKDIGAHLGVTTSRVEQLMSRASSRMREMDIQMHEVAPGRAGRLHEIEHRPPQYIVASIGGPPPANPKQGGHEVRREWKRIVLAIEDFRESNGITDQALALGAASEDPAQQQLRERMRGFRQQRGLSRGIEL